MTRQRRLHAWGLCLLLAVGGCGRTDSKSVDDTAGYTEALPLELTGARLVYERSGGVYVKELPAGPSRRLVADATWPRWAPDGNTVFCVRGNELLQVDTGSGVVQVVHQVTAPRALAIPPPGDVLYFTEDQRVARLLLATGRVETVCEGQRYLELDVSPHGRRIVYTVKRMGFQVRGLDVGSGREQVLGRGCSAGVSPDGSLVMVNQRGHQRLALVRFEDGVEAGAVTVPKGLQADNQAWSNHPDWIVSITEGARQDVLAHRVADDRFWFLTEVGDGDRPDLWLPLPQE